MSFITRAFTPPGSGAYVPPPMAPTAAAIPDVPAPPTVPQPTAQAAAPPSFTPSQISTRRVATGAGAATFLGAAAAAGQTAKTKATLG